jgi:hypothetical protein
LLTVNRSKGSTFANGIENIVRYIKGHVSNMARQACRDQCSINKSPARRSEAKHRTNRPVRTLESLRHCLRGKVRVGAVDRQQMVGDGLQLTLDAMYWSGINPNEEPIVLPMDLGPDIEWRLNAPDDDEEAA